MNTKPLGSLTKHSRYSRDYRAKLHVKGCCIQCGEANYRLPKKLCSNCARKFSENRNNYYLANRDRELQAGKRRNFEAKMKALQIISRDGGIRCVYCGCDDLRILEVNHKNGGGSKEGKGGTSIYYPIVAGTRSIDDLEITCKVCNTLHYISQRYPEVGERFNVRFECESFREKPEKNEKPRKQRNNGEKIKLTLRSRDN